MKKVLLTLVLAGATLCGCKSVNAKFSKYGNEVNAIDFSAKFMSVVMGEGTNASKFFGAAESIDYVETGKYYAKSIICEYQGNDGKTRIAEETDVVSGKYTTSYDKDNDVGKYVVKSKDIEKSSGYVQKRISKEKVIFQADADKKELQEVYVKNKVYNTDDFAEDAVYTATRSCNKETWLSTVSRMTSLIAGEDVKLYIKDDKVFTIECNVSEEDENSKFEQSLTVQLKVEKNGYSFAYKASILDRDEAGETVSDYDTVGKIVFKDVKLKKVNVKNYSPVAFAAL